VKLEHAFDVPAPPEAALDMLLNAEQVVPCMPGAELTEVVDDRHWKAKMTVKLGPVGMDLLNDVKLLEVDRGAGTVKMETTGRDTRGKGGANAQIEARLTAIEGGTRIQMDTDIRFSGQAAQLGRPSVVQDVSSKLVGQFAECLRSRLDAAPDAQSEGAPGEPRPPPPRAKPISGLALFRIALKGWFARLFGRGNRTRQGGSA
jgi:carbon monoxide dehydrogenase subunit G